MLIEPGVDGSFPVAGTRAGRFGVDMRWAARSLTSLLNYSLLQVIWWMLRAERLCNPGLQAPSALVLSTGDFSIVFWQARPVTPSQPQCSQPTGTATRSTR